jgi:hypothetical protein
VDLSEAFWIENKDFVLRHPKEQIFGRAAQALDLASNAELQLRGKFVHRPHGNLLLFLFWLLAVDD